MLQIRRGIYFSAADIVFVRQMTVFVNIQLYVHDVENALFDMSIQMVYEKSRVKLRSIPRFRRVGMVEESECLFAPLARLDLVLCWPSTESRAIEIAVVSPDQRLHDYRILIHSFANIDPAPVFGSAPGSPPM